VEEYATVFQTTATVEGKLAANKDRFDLLRACFPGGRLPDAQDPRHADNRRAWTSPARYLYREPGIFELFRRDGFNILIRSILKKDECLYFGVGGGIVADSSPSSEYQETLVKAQGIFNAIVYLLPHLSSPLGKRKGWGKKLMIVKQIVFLNGKFIPVEKALVSPMCPGLLSDKVYLKQCVLVTAGLFILISILPDYTHLAVSLKLSRLIRNLSLWDISKKLWSWMVSLTVVSGLLSGSKDVRGKVPGF